MGSRGHMANSCLDFPTFHILHCWYALYAFSDSVSLWRWPRFVESVHKPLPVEMRITQLRMHLSGPAFSRQQMKLKKSFQITREQKFRWQTTHSDAPFAETAPARFNPRGSVDWSLKGQCFECDCCNNYTPFTYFTVTHSRKKKKTIISIYLSAICGFREVSIGCSE